MRAPVLHDDAVGTVSFGGPRSCEGIDGKCLGRQTGLSTEVSGPTALCPTAVSSCRLTAPASTDAAVTTTRAASARCTRRQTRLDAPGRRGGDLHSDSMAAVNK